MRLETVRGAKRSLLLATEYVAYKLSHHVVFASASLLRAASVAGLPVARRSSVPGAGSVLGMSSPWTREQVLQGPARPAGRVVFVYVGRLVRDKGIVELMEAFTALAAREPEVHLQLWGTYEEGDPLPPAVGMAVADHPAVQARGWVGDVVLELHDEGDVVVLPSYREGFPTTALEAYAAGLPVITTSATGAVDSVRDGETGLLCLPGDAVSLQAAMQRLVEDDVARRSLGAAGHAWLEDAFTPQSRLEHFEDVYRTLRTQRAGSLLRRLVRLR